MANLLLVLLCLAAGVLARRSGRAPRGSAEVLTRVVLDVGLPALTLGSVHGFVLRRGRALDVLVPALVPWFGLALAAALVGAACRVFRWDRRTFACLVLATGFANTSFVGFPLIEALYGPAGLSHAILADQSSFVMVASVGTVLAALAGGGERPSAARVALRVASFPPFVALVLALALRPVPFPAALTALLARLGALVVPLSLLAVGLELRVDLRTLRRAGARVSVGLLVRLVLVPALLVLLLRVALHQRGPAASVALCEMAMAPMITACLLAINAGLEPELATLMMGLGVPLSLATVPLWYLALR